MTKREEKILRQINKKHLPVRLKLLIFITLLTSLLVIVKAIQEYKEKKKTEFTFETFLKCMQADVDSGVFDTEEYKKFAEEMLKRGTNEEKIY